MLPERLEISGVWYVREDALPVPSGELPDRWEPVKALCAEYGVDPHRAYDAIRAGALVAPLPYGNAKRGRRCRRSEFVRWMDEGLMGRRA